VEAVLQDTPENRFLADFREFQGPMTRAGLWNALSQVLLKIASPGVPDFYQGNELWTFTLVDPDNRDPVDYARRREMLAQITDAARQDCPGLVRRLAHDLTDGAAKLHLTSRALSFRREHSPLLAEGAYASLLATGARANHVIAFARIADRESAVVLAGRFFLEMTRNSEVPVGEEAWGDTLVLLPRLLQVETLWDVISGRTVETTEHAGKRAIRLADAFRLLPQALLHTR